MRTKVSLLAACTAFLTAFACKTAVSVELKDLRAGIKGATGSFTDLKMSAKVKTADQEQLKAIGPDYGQAYQFENQRLMFKMPDKVKITAKKGIVTGCYILTGDKKIIRFGPFRKTDDISGEPHKKQTALDIGLVTEALWDQFAVAYERQEKNEGHPCHVVTITLSNSPDKKQYLWVDAKDYRLWKREKREADGSLKVRYVFGEHRQIGGIWIPGSLKIYNSREQLAAHMVYSDVEVNTGISDDEFN